jgi:hypothetical protein
MSLHEIFDYVWNAQIPWLWIFGVIGGLWLAVFAVIAVIGLQIKKEGRNVQKP